MTYIILVEMNLLFGHAKVLFEPFEWVLYCERHLPFFCKLILLVIQFDCVVETREDSSNTFRGGYHTYSTISGDSRHIDLPFKIDAYTLSTHLCCSDQVSQSIFEFYPLIFKIEWNEGGAVNGGWLRYDKYEKFG